MRISIPLHSAADRAPVIEVTPDRPAIFGQLLHCSWPISDWYDPFGQAMHNLLVALKYVPTAQGTQSGTCTT